jgi:uncharacterized protein
VIALELDVLPGAYAVCRWPAREALPEWVSQGGFVSVTRTSTELSAVCAAEAVPAGTVCEGPWRIFAVRGPLDFGLTGVMASMASPLADASISLFAVSTYDTDYVLVRAGDLDRAVEALKSARHRVFETRQTT